MTPVLWILAVVAALALLVRGLSVLVLRMPGKSHEGPIPPLSDQEHLMKERIHRDVRVLAGEIGERNIQERYNRLLQAAAYLETSLTAATYAVVRQEIDCGGKIVWNLWGEKTGTGRPGEIILIGAHYDTVTGSPGADDNASAVAVLLELARFFENHSPNRTLRFAFFPNEEEPHFMTYRMGSRVHAESCVQKKEKIKAMICLESIGYYPQERGTQRYPLSLGRFYPPAGNFIAFVGNLRSRALVRAAVDAFREHTPFPSEGIAAPLFLKDICRSDHLPFWLKGYPAFMVTDTANFRNPHYHQPTDTPERLDYDALTRVTFGLRHVIEKLSKL